MQATSIFDIQPVHGEGPVWCPITQKFYCVDLLKGSYFKVDWKSGKADNEFPDGFTIDAEGGFWLTMWEGYKISHFVCH